MNKKGLYFFLFLVGLFAEFRVHLVGMIGLSEILIVLASPYLFIKDVPYLKRDGFMPLVIILLLTCISCLISSWLNHTPLVNCLRGFATPVVFLSSVIFMHHFLRNNLSGMKWFMLGYIISGFFTFLVKGQSVDALLLAEGADVGGEYQAGVTRMYILIPLFLIPVYSFYTKIPSYVSFALCSLVGVYTISASASGRAAALTFLAAACLIAIGGKSVRRMQHIKTRFLLFCLIGVLFVFFAKVSYSYAARSGLLGEASRAKYIAQTSGGDSIIRLLVGGRAESFICVMAALDRPIFGFGPWAQDTEGYSRRFLEKYGTDEEVIRMMRSDAYRARFGICDNVRFIPFHSHIFGQWVWYGIMGLILWLYALYLVVQYYRKYVDVVPQWYGMMALVLAKLGWDIFFSPFFARVETGAILVCILFARALFEHRITFDVATWEERKRYLN